LTSPVAYQIIGTQPFDVIFANIVADVLISLADVFFSLCKPGGVLIASGILDERALEVIQALGKSGFRIRKTFTSEGWTAVIAEK
jgi:ribosomal protein L11 methyltransferase